MGHREARLTEQAPLNKRQNPPRHLDEEEQELPVPSHPLIELQQTAGNQAVAQLMRSPLPGADLAVSHPGDPCEIEADRAAEKVMSIQHENLPQPEHDQTGNISVRNNATGSLRMNETGLQSLMGSGEKLSRPLRRFFEPRFGTSLGGVQLHTDERSGAFARALNARAFAYGNDIVFKPGEYSPETREGKKLIAHELAHVLQPHTPGLVQRVPEEGPVDIDLPVDLIGQPTPISCWAAALAMVINYRDSVTLTPDAIAEAAGMNTTTPYGWGAIQNAVGTWGLSETGPMSAVPSYWADLLAQYGPLWVVEVGAPYHAVVLGGLHGTGEPDSTEAWIYNPWPPGSGTLEFKTFLDFDADFGLGEGASASIVHA